ncbi:MAG: hypothetical protein PHG96_03380 [Kiritimatiellae bacterium]|nr:hypothetical protein [Kiritimatiellia bacterium]
MKKTYPPILPIIFGLLILLPGLVFSQSGFSPNGDPPPSSIDVVWQTHDDNIPLDGDPYGAGKRIFPEKKTLSDSETSKRRKVEAKATITPAIGGKTIYFKIFDVDDPSSSFVIDTNGDNGVDNFQENDPSTVIRNAVTDANGEAVIEFSVTRYPGNNYRVIAGRNYDDVNNVDQTQVENDSVPSNIAISQILTVWRMLHLEIDSMGSEPSSHVFDDDDLLRGDVPDPDIGALQNSLRPCYIDIDTQAFSQFSSTSEPWNHNFSEREGSMDYYAGFLRGSDSNRDYWGLQIIGAYEYWDVMQDNDEDEYERGTIGITKISSSYAGKEMYCMIFNETLRDMAADPSHVASLSYLSQEVVVHEIGHTLGAEHDFSVPPRTVMWSYEGYPDNEPYIAQTVFDFSDDEIRDIRQLIRNEYEN